MFLYLVCSGIASWGLVLCYVVQLIFDSGGSQSASFCCGMVYFFQVVLRNVIGMGDIGREKGFT